MLWAFGFLILALLIKDTVPIGDVYVLRSLSQGMCLAMGVWWLFTRGSVATLQRYWLILAYCGILSGTAFVSADPWRVLLQVLSLTAVTLFFVGFCEQAQEKPTMQTIAARIATYALLPICVGSLLLYKIAPTLSYDQSVESLAWDNTHRFKGLFGKPGGIAAASGILLGLCVFTQVHWIVRAAGAGSAILCMYLTLSRSFWIGSFVALAATLFLYVRRKGLLLALGIGGLLATLLLVVFLNVNTSTLNQSKAMRSDSLENLSGRTTVWALALTRFWDRPLLGYGYTEGHHAFLYSQHGRKQDSSGENVGLLRNETFSLHNGYIQALLDSGGLGALVYVALISMAAWRMVWHDTAKVHASALYSLIFLSIANIGETLVYTPATFHATYYWYAAILALGLRPSLAPDLAPPVSKKVPAEPVKPSRYPILSYPTT